ncbi:hypothetical protein P170DRAFT_285832 [Aspergillus steynii IBT 23096]|uniref:DUF7719 domain-containing protein n=1 Tax=Aspergillus steynii IBT 23096 TaxID=1392250 RepID=A0A2I2FUQ6_9EURO|nr:uncharacterized protein P170DRAFT_285832 [Aspergillus steynii IBT 23096]PLB44379.1 hypothetical protein P170DRAFT_285832 [Aspergillus steynii IBT 23096]
MTGPRNRKERRAAAASSADDTFDPASIPMAHPPRESKKKQKSKTLVDLIAERQKDLLAQGMMMPDGTGEQGAQPGTRFVTIDPRSGKIANFDGPTANIPNPGLDSTPRVQEIESDEEVEDNEDKEEEEEEDEEDTDDAPPIPPFIDTLLLAIPLTTLHLTLAYLAAHQYAESINMEHLLKDSGYVAFPILTFLIHLAHGHIVSFAVRADPRASQPVSLLPFTPDKRSFSFLWRLVFPPSLRTLIFLPIAVALGVKLVTITNEEAYYAVMKRAPAIGTIWVWSILEIPLGAALLGALGPIAWAIWWKGYGII